MGGVRSCELLNPKAILTVAMREDDSCLENLEVMMLRGESFQRC